MLHKESKGSLLLFGAVTVLGIFLSYSLPVLGLIFSAIGIFFFLFFVQFFRNPVRTIPDQSVNNIYAPADGKIVVIENRIESEYFKDERMMISVFMSPLNVHVNRSPFDGVVNYKKHHKGKFLMAFNPKSSTDNERCTTVFENSNGVEILYRQVAGFLARRIMNYMKEGTIVKKGDDYGFIKLGSRVDIFLPLDTKIDVNMGQMVYGNKDILAVLKS